MTSAFLHPALLRRLRSTFAFVAILVSLSQETAVAQYNTAELEGIVKDEQGAPAAGASIVAVHVRSGLKIERLSDGGGRFFLPGLPVGEYVVTVELPGFRRFTQTG